MFVSEQLFLVTFYNYGKFMSCSKDALNVFVPKTVRFKN